MPALSALVTLSLPMTTNQHMAHVYLAQARATPWPQFRTVLVRWARRRLHEHIRSTERGQLEIPL